MPASPDTPEHEHWSLDAGTAAVAQLDVPPALRDRTFEVSCSLAVRSRADADEHAEGDDAAWHELTLRVDGRQQWSRRVPTHPGPGDSLDYRFRTRVDAGDALRLVASSRVNRAVRVRLLLTADEEVN